MQSTSTCFWFDNQPLEVATFYVSLLPDSRYLDTTYYQEGGLQPAGSVLTVQFLLAGTEYLALNGGPHFKFSPAISIAVYCDTQAEIDALCRKLLEDGQLSQWTDPASADNP